MTTHKSKINHSEATSMGFVPGSLEIYKGEPVQYATGYNINLKVIKLHFFGGILLSLTFILAILGIPIILRGIYLNRRSQKAIIVTKTLIYELDRTEIVWKQELSAIVGMSKRTSTFAFLDIKFKLENGAEHIIHGNFYDNEVDILYHVIFSNR